MLIEVCPFQDFHRWPFFETPVVRSNVPTNAHNIDDAHNAKDGASGFTL